VPAGPWLAAVLDSVDPRQLSEWDLPAYLRASARLQAWAAARVSDGGQVLAGRTDTDHAVPYPAGPTQVGNLLANDRTWHNGHARQQLSVTVDDSGAVKWTSVLGQSRTVTPYDYRTDIESADADEPFPDVRSKGDPPPF
jgi:hypothetical protein